MPEEYNRRQIIEISMTSKIHRCLKIVLIMISLSVIFQFFIHFRNEKSQISATTVSSKNHIRGVIVTLIRSTNQSIFLTINMIYSVIHFYSTTVRYRYPFIIFHDENFTSSMRQQILSCILKNNKQIQISFALVNFQTSIQPSNTSRLEKPIGYRLMCRFWRYDGFYHPAIIEGHYDYLMRMDDDSYFMDTIGKNLFLYMDSQKLDYIYRSLYDEPITPMDPILQRFLNKNNLKLSCIHNNFFVIRLKWYYESKQVQSFVHELIQDNFMLREYVDDGCAHLAMLEIDNQVKVEHVTDISYGHNFHLMLRGSAYYMFYFVDGFLEEMFNSCQ